jgi:multidrug resistance efflux pump
MNDGARRALGRALGIVIVAGAVVTSVWVWILLGRHPRTDDASVRANIVNIAPHVSGPIVDLPVVDNQPVRQGEVLFVVDPRPYEAKLEATRADLDMVESDLEAQRSAVKAADALIAQREAESKYATDYHARLAPLLQKKFVTADAVADAQAKQRAAEAALSQARSERVRAEQLLAQVGELNSRRQAAEAAVRSAKLDVDYCRVTAPFDGYVTNLNIAVGQYARQGEQVFALVDTREWYVMANFRETYLDAIRPGMAAEVNLLSYPDRPFRGVVQGIGWAVQTRGDVNMAGVPAIEPTLDWVRLAQRFPVRIRLDPPDPERPYRMGASAVVTIRPTRDTAR